MFTYREKLKKKFNEEFDRLNSNQQLAVNTIEGPVMVIAGPGTGKTQILAARIGKILLETDALPNNILCLTYTEAGAIAMRRRLLDFIGPDAYRVTISTFHAFCNDIIQDNLSFFEKNSLSPISDLERIELFKKLIDTLPKNHPLKRYRGEEYYEIDNLKNLFSVMKRENWTADFLSARIDEYINSLPQREEYVYKRAGKGFQKGDLKVNDIKEETDRMEKLKAAVNEFDRYKALMSEWRRYDFDDMITWVIRAFEENKNLLSHYQEQFQYVLVDEYQDTSGAQNQLVSLLINYWDKPNIFVVGDDDQSIFRFQGANVENMMELRNNYADDLYTVVLNHNYRSTQPILDVSKKIIDRNEERLIKKIDGLTKDLLSSGKEVKHITLPPIIREYHSEKDEMAGLAADIEKLLAQNVKPGRIAVIYREHRYGMELARYLRLNRIPVYSRKMINLLEEPFIRRVLKIVEYVAAELDITYSGDSQLFEILHFDFYGIAPIEIAKMTVKASDYDKANSLRKVLYETANPVQPELFDNGPDENIAKVSSFLEHCIKEANNVSLPKLFEWIVTDSGALKWALASDARHFNMQALASLFDFVKEETRRNPYLTIKELVEMIALMKKQKLELPMMQVMGSENGVNLLTAHGSKGLEFEYVFVAGTVAGAWEKKRGNNSGYKLPDTLFRTVSTQTDMEEQRRLFYVALTRAEKQLLVSYFKHDNSGKEQEPSRFIAEMQEANGLPIETIGIDEELRFKYNVLQFSDLAPEIEKAEEDFIAPILERFVMNVTALNNYLDCPLNFYYNSLLRIPSAKGEAAVFGSAVHHSLEQLFKKMLASKEKTGKEIFPSAEELIADFKQYMLWNRENFTTESYKRKMEYGEEILNKYYQKYVGTWGKIALVELNVKGVVVNGIPLKGKLDKIEFSGKEVNVVDYKTGDPDKAKEKLKGPSDKDPLGGNYWRQAVFYKLLLDNFKQKQWSVVSTEFDFVEPDKSKAITKALINITEADQETVRQQITEVWNKIQAREFYKGCGDAKCHWCNFVKENHLAVEMHEIEEEA